ncbi:MAG TPA: WxcM-like domain-containing protein [Verrucomicrobiaceae bacterium]
MNPGLVHPSAICESRDLGEGTSVGAFARIAAGARVGRRCHIGSYVCIEGGMMVEDDVFIAAGVHFSTGFSQAQAGVTDNPIILRRGCRIDANATIAAGVVVGEQAVVTVGSVVTASVQPFAVVSGNPARVTGFANTEEAAVTPSKLDVRQVSVIDSKVRGVRAYELPFIPDPRGNLTVGEFGKDLPFIPQRYFVTFNVPSFHLRGEHAHKLCQQFLICVRGSCAVVVDDGSNKEEFLLDRPTFGVYVPPLVWATEYKHSPDSTLMVFASHHYDPQDYIRDYGEFRKAAAARSSRPPGSGGFE